MRVWRVATGICETAIRTDAELATISWNQNDKIVVLGHQGFYGYRFSR